MREFFEERFESIEKALARLERKLDCVSLLQTRIALVEDRQKLIFWIVGVIGAVVVGGIVERLLSLI